MRDKKKKILIIALVAVAIITIQVLEYILVTIHGMRQRAQNQRNVVSAEKLRGKHWVINGEMQHVRNHKFVPYVIEQRARS